MIVLIIQQFDILVNKAKSNAPVSTYPQGIVSLQISFKGVETISREIQFLQR